MTLAAMLVASAVSVPPYGVTADHSQPMHYTQPTRRYFTRKHVDDARGHAWMNYVDELDRHWAEYRLAGSTPEAWERYKMKTAASKRCYVYQDPYYIGQVESIRYVTPEDYRDCEGGDCAKTRPPEPDCEACGAGPATHGGSKAHREHKHKHHRRAPVHQADEHDHRRHADHAPQAYPETSEESIAPPSPSPNDDRDAAPEPLDPFGA